MAAKPLLSVAGALAEWLQGSGGAAGSTAALSTLWSAGTHQFTVLCFLRRLG
jgi:hypothetical protein